MLIAYKDVVRLALPGEPPAMLEITVARAGPEWEARVRFRHAPQPWMTLGRRFRAQARGEALGKKMVRWVRGKFPTAMPVPERQASGC